MPIKMNKNASIIRKAAEKKLIGKKGTMVMTKDNTSKSAPVGDVVKSAEKLAEVRVGIGSTLNMGNYESLRLGVDISLPSTEKDLEKTFNKALELAEKNLERMITKFKGPQNQVLQPGSSKRSAQEVLDDDEIDEDDLESDNPDDEVEL